MVRKAGLLDAVLVAAALLAAGCASSTFYLSPRVERAVHAADPDLGIRRLGARVNKGVLEIEARVARTDGEYEESLGPEMETAAAVCAALARSEVVFAHDWREMDLLLWNEYGGTLRWRNTVGFVRVGMSRETLRALRDGSVPASEYRKHWRLLGGSKAGPGGRLQEWMPAVPGTGPDDALEGKGR